MTYTLVGYRDLWRTVDRHRPKYSNMKSGQVTTELKVKIAIDWM